MYIIEYTRQDFNSASTTTVLAPSIPPKGVKISEWISEFPEAETPKSEPCEVREMGGEWTSHYYRFWQVSEQ